MNIAESARTLIFVGHWDAKKGRIFARRGRMRGQTGCKFVEAVQEVTFFGPRAVAEGKRVFYVTSVGVFRLEKEGSPSSGGCRGSM